MPGKQDASLVRISTPRLSELERSQPLSNRARPISACRHKNLPRRHSRPQLECAAIPSTHVDQGGSTLKPRKHVMYRLLSGMPLDSQSHANSGSGTYQHQSRDRTYPFGWIPGAMRPVSAHLRRFTPGTDSIKPGASGIHKLGFFGGVFFAGIHSQARLPGLGSTGVPRRTALISQKQCNLPLGSGDFQEDPWERDDRT